MPRKSQRGYCFVRARVSAYEELTRGDASLRARYMKYFL